MNKFAILRLNIFLFSSNKQHSKSKRNTGGKKMENIERGFISIALCVYEYVKWTLAILSELVDRTQQPTYRIKQQKQNEQ